MKRLGPFLIDAEVESGPYSRLFLASDPKSDAPIVIKALNPNVSEEAEVAERFLEEAKIIRLQNHPNIVKLLDSGTSEEGLYIAMEAIDGIRLKEAIATLPLSLKKRVEIILEIAYAVCHLHTHHVIHRDLKPENILLDQSLHVKVIDFGIARLLTELENKKGHRFIGTPIYMSPEQKEDPASLSYPSDIYSLGIVAYELIIGRIPRGTLLLSLLPKGLQNVIAKSLMPNPCDRYLDIVDFITDLSSYFHSQALIEDETDYFPLYKEFESYEIQRDQEPIPLLNTPHISYTHFYGPLRRNFFLYQDPHTKTLLIANGEGSFWQKGLLHSFLEGFIPALFKEARYEEKLDLLSKSKTKPFHYCLIPSSPEKVFHASGFVLYIQKNGSWNLAENGCPLNQGDPWLILSGWPDMEQTPILSILNGQKPGPYFLEKLIFRLRFLKEYPKGRPLLTLSN